MGYTTDFDGRFNLDHPLTPEHAAYLHAFGETRRMARDPKVYADKPDPIRAAVGLPLGPQCAYYTGSTAFAGQDYDSPGIIGHGSTTPQGQPGLWCQWLPTDDLGGIEWNGGEKFYNYDDWMTYLIEHFLAPWGYTVSGAVTYSGESDDDQGTLTIVDGVCVKTAAIRLGNVETFADAVVAAVAGGEDLKTAILRLSLEMATDDD